MKRNSIYGMIHEVLIDIQSIIASYPLYIYIYIHLLQVNKNISFNLFVFSSPSNHFPLFCSKILFSSHSQSTIIPPKTLMTLAVLSKWITFFSKPPAGRARHLPNIWQTLTFSSQSSFWCFSVPCIHVQFQFWGKQCLFYRGKMGKYMEHHLINMQKHAYMSGHTVLHNVNL